MAWPSVSLFEFCRPKQWPTIQQSDLTESGYPVYGANGRIGFYSEYNHERPTVLITCRGATCGTINVCEPKSYVTGNAMALDGLDESKIVAEYLVYALRNASLSQAISGTAQPQITRQSLTAISIPLPPLPEQKRIAEILDRAEALRAKRRAALAQLDTLTQSIFLDLFGIYSGKGWTTSTMGEIALPAENSLRTGPFGSQLLHSEFISEGIAVLGIDNAVHNEFRWDQRRFISENKYRQLKRYTVHPGDVLITIMGTCGRCAVVPNDIPTAINTKHLCCITTDREKCLPLFLHAYFLRHPVAQTYLAQTAKGAIMTGLNMGLIKQMPIVLPPIKLQQEFARRAAAVEKLKAAHRQSLAELDALFASLQHRAFRGEL